MSLNGRFTFQEALLAFLMAALVFGTPRSSWAQSNLFKDIDAQLTLGQAREARTYRFRTVNVDFGLLGPGRARHSLRFNLFDGMAFTARSDLIQRAADGVTVWQGRLEGIPHGEVILAYKENNLSGNISLPGARYWVRSLGNGLHVVMEGRPEAYPAERDPPPVFAAAPSRDPALPKEAFPGPAAPIIAAGPFALYLPTIFNPPIFNVLVVYTPAARLAAGGSAAMDTLIHLAVRETNTGYGNSGIRQVLNLVHAQEVDYSESGFDWDLALDRLTGMNDGYLDQVHILRDTYKADAVVLMVDNGLFCGQSWLMTSPQPSFAASAFSLVNWDCATGNYSFAHELGHLMGSHHDWNTTSEIGCFTYSKGYQAPNRSFRTIMAYDCPGGCPRINHWSNPDILYNGQPTGVYYLGSNPADNRRSINSTTPVVIKWR
jgi:peptidyl-Asp metalloendopeptidase